MYRVISYCVLTTLIVLNIHLHKDATPEIDKELKPYVDTFLEYCDYYKVDCDKTLQFKIKLVSMKKFDVFYKMLGMKGSIIGHCWKQSKEIEINVEYFKTANHAEMEQLVIHELGHCVLDLEHKEDNVAIMNPYSLYYAAYLLSYNELMNDFFGCKIPCPQLQFNQNKY